MHSRFRPLFAFVLVALAVVPPTGCNKKTDTGPLLAHAAEIAAAGKLDDAKVEYAKVLAIDPNNAVANARTGLIWSEQGAPLRAIPYLVKAQKADPKNAEIRLKLAYAFLSVGRLAPAKREAKELLEMAQDHKPALTLLAESIQTSADYEYAERTLRQHSHRTSEHGEMASAILLLRRGNVDKAREALQNAVRIAPTSSAAHLALANCLLLQNNVAEAEKEFRAAADASPTRGSARIVYAGFLADRGDPAAATAYLTKLTTEAPDYLPAWHLLAQIALRTKKYDEATAALQNMLHRDPGNYDAQMIQAQVWLSRGETKKGIEALEAIATAYPNLAADKFALAREHLKARNFERATALLKKALAANPDHIDAALALGEVHLRHRRYQEVVGLMLDLVDRHPLLLKAQVLLIDGLRLSGKLDAAAKVLREQSRMYPKSPMPYYYLGVVQAQQRNYDEARKNLEKSLQLAPDRLPVVTTLVDIDLAEGKYPVALQRAQTIRSRMPSSAEANFLEAKVHAAMNSWDKAEAGFSKTLDLDPTHQRASDLLVYTYAAQNKIPQKLAEAQATLAKQPQDVRALRSAGIMHLRLGQFEAARDIYERLVALQPNASHILNDLAYVYSEKLNQADRAYELARRARELDSASPYIADTLGWILYKRQDYAAAFELLEESALRRPLDPEVQLHLGLAGRKVGRNDVAHAALGRAAKATDFAGKAEAERELAALAAETRQN